jgi:hypothetical protein
MAMSKEEFFLKERGSTTTAALDRVDFPSH